MNFSRIILFLILAIRNVRKNKRRSLITLATVTVGVWSAVSLSSLARGVSNQIAEQSINNLLGHIQLHAPSYLSDPSVENSFAPVSVPSYFGNVPIVAAASRVRVPAIVMSERETAGVTLVGISPESEGKLSFIKKAIISGHYLESEEDRGIIIGKKLAKLIQTALGKRIVVATQAADGSIADRGFRIIGIFDADLESSEKSFVFIGIKGAQELLGLGDKISEVSLKVDDRKNIDSIIGEAQIHFNGLDVRAWNSIEPLASAILKIQDNFLLLWFGIVVTAILFGVINTLFMSIFERTREFGMMQALGLNGPSIMLIIIFESVVLLLIGLLLGNLMGLSLYYYYSNGLNISGFSAGAQTIGISNIIYPYFRPSDWIQANLLVLIFGVFGSFYPAYRGSRLEPIAAMRIT